MTAAAATGIGSDIGTRYAAVRHDWKSSTATFDALAGADTNHSHTVMPVAATRAVVISTREKRRGEVHDRARSQRQTAPYMMMLCPITRAVARLNHPGKSGDILV